MKELNKLRQQCLVLMAKNGFAKNGSLIILADKIKVNRNQLSMALTGYRETSGSEKILKELKSILHKPTNNHP
jgi:hypothetical protein